MSTGVALWLLLTWLWLCLAPLASPSPAASASALPKSAQDPEAWFILDQADQGSSVLLRRITPKSVFVAPTLGCSHGYQEDALGRCIKTVKVDQANQWDFYLKRLQSMFGPTTNKKPAKEEQPFHINLPIGDSRPEADSPTVSKRRPVISWPPKTTFEPKITSTTKATTPTVQTLETDQEEKTSTIRQTLHQLEVTSERDLELQTSFTTENKVPAFTEGGLQMVMLADQPVLAEETTETSTEIPNTNNVRQSEKPFIIIVTNETTTKSEETYPPSTTFVPLNTEEDSEEAVSEATSIEMSTEITTETTPRIWTDSTSVQTDYEEQYSETRDTLETSIRPTVRDETPPSEVRYEIPTTTVRYKPSPVPVEMEPPSTTVRYEALSTINPPVRYLSSTVKCSPDSGSRDGSSDCEPQESEVKIERATNSPISLPPNMPLLEPNVQVRFPAESYAPVRKTQSYVRFPEVANPHDDRPSMWWPQWQVRQHPDIRGWPPSDDRPSYPPHHTWVDHNAWRRRIFSQRD